MELSLEQSILRAVASAMQTPVIVILIAFIAFAAFCIGWLIVEAFVERRDLLKSLPALLDKMKAEDGSLEECIKKSGLLARQKKVLLELISHPDFTKEMIESLGDNLLEREQAHYDIIQKPVALVSKLAPMVGLLGTLIPLGPGIIALGKGDTYTLSMSMLTAFDTTIAGILTAAVCLVIHAIRKRWYGTYMSDLETLVDCTVDMVGEKCQD